MPLQSVDILLFNQSTVLHDTDIQDVLGAFQEMMSKHFGPYYGLNPALRFGPVESLNPGEEALGFFDTSDEAGALGYHDYINGRVLGKVFAKTDLLYSSSWTVTATHELQEQAADPRINQTAPSRIQGRRSVAAYEVSDACESDTLAYTIGGVLISDFCLPAWFDQAHRHPKGTKFSYQDNLDGPYRLAPGGYMQYLWKGQWIEVDAPPVASAGSGTAKRFEMRPRVGSRRERRRIGEERWIESHPRSVPTLTAL